MIYFIGHRFIYSEVLYICMATLYHKVVYSTGISNLRSIAIMELLQKLHQGNMRKGARVGELSRRNMRVCAVSIGVERRRQPVMCDISRESR